jgi:hypothetical protein
VSFLNQLKSHASALQSEQSVEHIHTLENIRLTEAAAKTAWFYITELAKQLNVIEPPGPKLSLDGKTQWPVMKLTDFRADSRKKKLLDEDVTDYIALSWTVVPQSIAPVGGTASANFPPDLQRIEARLAAGNVKHERVSVRHPEKNTLQAIRFDYIAQARAGITVTMDHLAAKLVFRLANLQSFAIVNTEYRADQIQASVLDELAKLVVGQESRFV